MRIACSTASFPEDRLEIAIAKVAWAGYDGVELEPAGGEIPDEAQLGERLREEGLELAAIAAGAFPSAGGAEALAPLGRAAAAARALDCRLCVMTPPPSGTLEGLAGALGLLDRALGALEVDLCLVNRRETLLPDPGSFHGLWSLGLPERVGLALDPAQAALAGWDPADLDALPELPRHVYLNDVRGGRVAPAGEGEVDLDGLADALRLRGYGGSVTVRLEGADPWAVEPAVRELREAAAGWFGR